MSLLAKTINHLVFPKPKFDQLPQKLSVTSAATHSYCTSHEKLSFKNVSNSYLIKTILSFLLFLEKHINNIAIYDAD